MGWGLGVQWCCARAQQGSAPHKTITAGLTGMGRSTIVIATASGPPHAPSARRQVRAAPSCPAMAQPQALTALRAAIARSRTAPSSPQVGGAAAAACVSAPATCSPLASPLTQVRPAPARPAAPSSAFAGLHVEELQLCSEADNAASLQAWVPLRIVGPPAAAPSNGTQQQQQRQRPAVILLHATGVDMSSLAEQQAAFARRGFVAVAIDCR